MDISILDKERIIVIIRHNRPFDVEGLFQTVLDAGLHVIEITLNTPQSFNLIDIAVKSFGAKMRIGAGTVLSPTELRKALDVGVHFIVSPIFNQEMVEYCSERKVPVFPGALTPTEIYNAFQAGAHMVKVFPASMFGPSYLKSIKAPLPDIKILAVGGVKDNNVKDYLSNGADAVAIGAGIVKPEWVEQQNFPAIKDRIIRFRKAINQ